MISLLKKSQVAFRAHLSSRTIQGAVIKLPSHCNASEENFHILDIREELALSKETMLTLVKEGPWKETIQRHIEWKKQLLEDLTTKQINANLGRMINQEEQEYFKVLGRNRFSRETTIEQELREIIKETATGFCIQETIPVASLPRCRR